MLNDICLLVVASTSVTCDIIVCDPVSCMFIMNLTPVCSGLLSIISNLTCSSFVTVIIFSLIFLFSGSCFICMFGCVWSLWRFIVFICVVCVWLSVFSVCCVSSVALLLSIFFENTV